MYTTKALKKHLHCLTNKWLPYGNRIVLHQIVLFTKMVMVMMMVLSMVVVMMMVMVMVMVMVAVMTTMGPYV